MTDTVSTILHMNACVLRDRLNCNDSQGVRNARDKLRAEMTAHYLSGYWRDKPEKLRFYMDLLYRSETFLARLAPVLAMQTSAARFV